MYMKLAAGHTQTVSVLLPWKDP